MKKSLFIAASFAALLLLGCSREKGPAEDVVASIDASFAAAHDLAAKYVPEELQSVDTQVATLKGNLAKGDYKSVLASAQAVNTAVAKLKQSAEAKQAEAEAALAQTKQTWRGLGTDVPKMMAAIKGRVDAVSKSGKLPKGVTKAAFESIKTKIASLDATWTEATNALANEANEDYATAVAKGQSVKDQATEIMHTLGIAPG